MRNINCISILLIPILLLLLGSCNKNDDSNEHKDLLFGKPRPTMPIPNQETLISVEEGVVANSQKCTFTTMNSTSDEHAKMMVPDPASAYVVGECFELNSLIDGENAPVLTNLGGMVTITLRAGVYSDSRTVPLTRHDILEAITNLQQSIPEEHGQYTDISVVEGYSARHLGIKAGFFAHGPMFNVASGINFSSTDYEHNYQAMVVVKEFVIEITYPGSSKVIQDWFPNFKASDIEGCLTSPVFVSRQDWGKGLLCNISTNLSKDSVEFYLNSSFNGLLGGGDFNLNAGFHELQSKSHLTISGVGGSLSNIIETISGTNPLNDYLNSIVTDKTAAFAVPIFTQFAFVEDGSTAKVVLASDDYIIRDCQTFQNEAIDLNATLVDDPCGGTVQINPFLNICAIHTESDREFGGQCEQSASVELFLDNNDTELWVRVIAKWLEPNANYTEGNAYLEEKVFSAEDGFYIASIDSDTFSEITNELDTDHSVDVYHFDETECADRFEIHGDGPGNDLPENGAECYCHENEYANLSIFFNSIYLTLKEF